MDNPDDILSGGLVPSDPNKIALANPRVKGFLDKISQSEGADYNTLVGGKKINDLSRHPNVVGLTTSAGPSTAFGRYQITGTTNRTKLAKYKNLDYSPENQDLRAVELLRQTKALDALQAGDEQTAIKRAGREWASLPGSPLPGRKNLRAFQSPKSPNILSGGLVPQQDTSSETPDILSGGLVETPQQPQKTPRITSTIRELDTKDEVPQIEPIKFQPAKSDVGVIGRGAQNLSETVRLQNMKLPSNHPDLLGQHIEAKFDHPPTPEEVNDSLLEQLGKGYGSVGRKFAQETGQSLVGNAAVEKQPDGSYIAHAKPTQGFIDAVNAYAQGGRRAYENTIASQQVGRGNVAKDLRSALKQGEGIGQDIEQGAARGYLGAAQTVQNVNSLLHGRAPEDDPTARAVAQARQNIPASTTYTGGAGAGAIETLGTIAQAEGLGGNLPLQQTLENAQAGPQAAYKAGVLSAPLIATGPIGRAIGADALSPVARQATLRGIAGVGLGGAAVASGASPSEILKQTALGAAFPVGERNAQTEPTRLATGAITEANTPQGRPSVEAGQGETTTNMAAQIGQQGTSGDITGRRIQEPQATESGTQEGNVRSEAPRHVDLQARVKRGPNAGDFRKETKAETEARRAQVSQPAAEVTPPSASESPVAVKSPIPTAETTGIAHRVETQARGSEPVRGESIGAEESVQRGRDLLSKSPDPGRLVARTVTAFDKTGAVSPESMAIIRAQHEQLAQQANRAFDAGGINSPEFKAAEQARRDFYDNAVKPMQTAWSNTGRAQQGETAIDTGTFYGLYRAFRDTNGREMNPREQLTAKKLSDTSAAADLRVSDTQKRLVDTLNKICPP